MANIINTAVDYERKVDLIRAYSGYYTEEEFEEMFSRSDLSSILTDYAYNEMRAILVNTRTNTFEREVDIGDIVIVRKPYMREGTYTYVKGLVIGYHKEYDDDNRVDSIYRTFYDILVQTNVYGDGFSYEIKREPITSLTLVEGSISDVDVMMKTLSRYSLDQPV